MCMYTLLIKLMVVFIRKYNYAIVFCDIISTLKYYYYYFAYKKT